MKHQHKERGAAHLVLVLAFVVGLIGVLGFLGYSAWQKQSADAGGEEAVGRANPSVTVSPEGFGYYAQEIVQDRGKKAVLVPKPTGSTTAIGISSNYDEGRPLDGQSYLDKLGDFARKAAGKRVKVCAQMRLDESVVDREVELGQSYVVKVGENSSYYKKFKVGTAYKNYCNTANYISKQEMDRVIAPGNGKDFDVYVMNYSKTKLYVRQATLRVVE